MFHNRFLLWSCVCACITQAVAHDWHCPDKLWVSLFKEGVQTIDLWGHRVHYGLAIGRAVVEEQVEQSIVGEMSEPANAGQSDSLDVPGNWQRGRK